jgi:serum/glucocorticoid-regulated kinase 2
MVRRARSLLQGTGLTPGTDRTIDWWTLGILLYEMMAGLPPFYDERTDKMYEKILHVRFFRSPRPCHQCLTARRTRSRSRRTSPTRRARSSPGSSRATLGRQGAEAIKAHPFFSKHIDVGVLMQKKIQPPFKPRVTSPVDVSNFDAEFTAEPPMDSYKEGTQLSQVVQDQFYGARRRGPRGAGATLTAPKLLVQRRPSGNNIRPLVP